MKKYVNLIRLPFLLLAALLFVSYALPLLSGILNLGNLFGMCASGGILIVTIWYKKFFDVVRKISRKRFGKISLYALSAVLLAFVIAFFSTLSVICNYAQYTVSDENTVIVLGCKVNGETPSLQLYRRTMVACDYLNRNPDAVAILSGGKGSDENISEAQCMFNILTEQGISPDRLYLEDKSTSTVENFKFSKEIIEQNNLSLDVVVATNDYHEKRASMIAAQEGYTTVAIPAKCDIYTCTTSFTREVFAIWAQYLGL